MVMRQAAFKADIYTDRARARIAQRIPTSAGRRARLSGSARLGQSIPWLTQSYDADSGITVTPETALSGAAVLSAVRRIAQGLAMLPCFVYGRMDMGKRRAPEHHLYPILHGDANPEVTSFEFFESMQASIFIYGNAYAWIERDNTGHIIALWQIPSRSMLVERIQATGLIRYTATMHNGTFQFTPDEILHVRDFTSSGLMGLCRVDLCRNALGISIAQEQYTSSFFRNDSTPNGLLIMPPGLDSDAIKNIEDTFTLKHSGGTNRHKYASLREGVDFKILGLSPEEAELIAGRTFQIQEVARIFDIPPHLLGELSRATFSNIEEQNLEFITYTLSPWIARWEGRLLRLFLPSERREYFAEFLIDALLRGDAQRRSIYYQRMVFSGNMTIDEVRARENYNLIGGEIGNTHWIPANMVPVGRAIAGITQLVEPNAKPGDDMMPGAGDMDKGSDDMRAAFSLLLVDSIRRYVRAELREMRKAVEKSKHLPIRPTLEERLSEIADERPTRERLLDHSQAAMRQMNGNGHASIIDCVRPVMARSIAGLGRSETWDSVSQTLDCLEYTATTEIVTILEREYGICLNANK